MAKQFDVFYSEIHGIHDGSGVILQKLFVILSEFFFAIPSIIDIKKNVKVN